MPNLTIELSADVLERVRREAQREHDTLAEWIGRAIWRHLQVCRPNAERAAMVLDDPFCRICGAKAPRGRRGLCSACYNRRVRPSHVRQVSVCTECHRERAIHARGKCEACYARWIRRRSTCRDCRAVRHLIAHGRCQPCYDRARRARPAVTG